MSDRFAAGPIQQIDVLWITAGLSCDGDTIAMTAATQPSIEDLIFGALPWVPKLSSTIPSSPMKMATSFWRFFIAPRKAPSIPLFSSSKAPSPMKPIKPKGIGHPSAPIRPPASPSPLWNGSTGWRPKAWAVIAAGTCATYGGIHAMQGNPTGCMGLADYLGWEWKSKAGIPIVCIPGCPVQPDNLTETLLYLLHMAAGRAPMIPLDDALRPTWLFGQTVHEGCDRGGYYEQAEFAEEYGSRTCIVKLGCWGPVVQCNVGKRGWMGGSADAPTSAASASAAPCPGFPDKFMPFMNQPPGSLLSSNAVMTYGRAIHALAALHAGVLE